MAAAPTSDLITAEQFLHMKEQEGAELVDGRIVEVPMGSMSSWLGGELLFLIRLFLSSNDIGWVFPQETGMAIWPNRPRHVRKPDLAFVRAGRLPGGKPEEGWLSVTPDLVVEIVSPGDTVQELEQKLEEYREAGIPLIWVIHPSVRRAHVLRPGQPRQELGPDDSLDGESVLPGFTCSLRQLFESANQEK